MPGAKPPRQLAKLLAYILARRPDEFGLVPDRQGYVKIKDLLKALSEEPGWGYVRMSHFNEILLTLPAPPIEISAGLIRATDRSRLDEPRPATSMPKLLYTCVRCKAHRFTLENGIRPADRPEVVLSADRNLAERMGRRRDRDAVTLTVNVQQAQAMGVAFERAGEALFTSGPIPVGCFSGPPLPKAVPESRPPVGLPLPRTAPQPGSFTIDLQDLTQKQGKDKRQRQRKQIGWKKDAKRKRRERPPWRQ
jgi:putative RNA 2'-phosphotransferase